MVTRDEGVEIAVDVEVEELVESGLSHCECAAPVVLYHLRRRALFICGALDEENKVIREYVGWLIQPFASFAFTMQLLSLDHVRSRHFQRRTTRSPRKPEARHSLFHRNNLTWDTSICMIIRRSPACTGSSERKPFLLPFSPDRDDFTPLIFDSSSLDILFGSRWPLLMFGKPLALRS